MGVVKLKEFVVQYSLSDPTCLEPRTHSFSLFDAATSARNASISVTNHLYSIRFCMYVYVVCFCLFVCVSIAVAVKVSWHLPTLLTHISFSAFVFRVQAYQFILLWLKPFLFQGK